MSEAYEQGLAEVRVAELMATLEKLYAYAKERGDYFMKPTGYWYTNCEPTHGFTNQQTPESERKVTGISTWSGRPNKHPRSQTAKGSIKSGLCSEERSMISPDYARNFICDFILGKPSGKVAQQADLFEEAK